AVPEAGLAREAALSVDAGGGRVTPRRAGGPAADAGGGRVGHLRGAALGGLVALLAGRLAEVVGRDPAPPGQAGRPPPPARPGRRPPARRGPRRRRRRGASATHPWVVRTGPS